MQKKLLKNNTYFSNIVKNFKKLNFFFFYKTFFENVKLDISKMSKNEK